MWSIDWRMKLRIPVFGFPVPHETYATNSPDYGASFSSYQMQESWIYSYFLKLPNFVDMDSLCIIKSRVKFWRTAQVSKGLFVLPHFLLALLLSIVLLDFITTFYIRLFNFLLLSSKHFINCKKRRKKIYDLAREWGLYCTVLRTIFRIGWLLHVTGEIIYLQIVTAIEGCSCRYCLSIYHE
jgi:hypothetical protein